MNFTFGIITNGEVKERVERVVDSILCQEIPEFEIIVVGGKDEWKDTEQVRHFSFDETIKNGWITAKKNMITGMAKYDNVVYMHDYFALDEGWYGGFLEFGDDWDVCMNRLTGYDGNRYIDWVAIGDPEIVASGYREGMLVPYDYNKTDLMYVSGGYWVAKKEFMFENPLDERITWGQMEDYEWSYRINKIKKCKYKMNANSSCSVIKEGKTSEGKHDEYLHDPFLGRVPWSRCSIHSVYNGCKITCDPPEPILSKADGWPTKMYRIIGEPECNYLKSALEENAE